MRKYTFGLIAILFAVSLMFTSCDGTYQPTPTESASGVTKATAVVKTDVNGHSIEQNQVAKRIAIDNEVGAIKHLYIISPYSGQVILYSTVKGKVTSGSKRLSPSTVAPGNVNNEGEFPIYFPGTGRTKTNEVMGDDGTYGSSSDYIFWFDSKNDFHQHFMTGGQIVHVSSQPMNVKSVIINVETKTAG